MGEKLNPNGENLEPKIDLSVESDKNLERIHEEATDSETDTQKNIDSLKSAAETQAISSKEITIGERETQSKQAGHVTKELKQMAYDKSLGSIRSQLSGSQKAFSRAIHLPAVETASNIAGKTIARPSGILVGGLVSAIGSLIVLYLAKRNGFIYNYSVFVVLFFAGYLAGVLLEFVMKLFRKSRA